MRNLATLIFAGMFGTSVALAESSGYLAQVGPPTLRFQPSHATVGRAALPPLQMTDPVAPPHHLPVEDSSALVTFPETLASETNTSQRTLTPVETPGPNVIEPTMPVELHNAGATVSPQLLLRFFGPTQPDRSHETVIVTSPSFTPARPATPVSSSATYTSPKR